MVLNSRPRPRWRYGGGNDAGLRGQTLDAQFDDVGSKLIEQQSRGQWDAHIFTNDREKLSQALGHDVSHQSAHTPDLKPPQHEIVETPKQEKSQVMDMGLSL